VDAPGYGDPYKVVARILYGVSISCTVEIELHWSHDSVW